MIKIASYERNFGTLTAYTSPTVADHRAGDRQATLYEAYLSGIPGYVDRGTMDSRQVLRYMARRLTSSSIGSGAPETDRPVDVILTTNGDTDELIATAEFDQTMTNAGLLASRDGTRIAHVTTFAVSGRSLAREKLLPNELRDVALVLGYATLKTTAPDFDEISYCVEETRRLQTLEQITSLGLADEVQNRAEIPHFTAPVTDAPGMVRTEYAVNIETAQTAMEAAHPWLALRASQ